MKHGIQNQYQSSSARPMSVSSVLFVCLVFAFLLHVAHWCYRGYYAGNVTTTQTEKQQGDTTESTPAFIIGLGVLCVVIMVFFFQEVWNHEKTKDKHDRLDRNFTDLQAQMRVVKQHIINDVLEMGKTDRNEAIKKSLSALVRRGDEVTVEQWSKVRNVFADKTNDGKDRLYAANLIYDGNLTRDMER